MDISYKIYLFRERYLFRKIGGVVSDSVKRFCADHSSVKQLQLGIIGQYSSFCSNKNVQSRSVFKIQLSILKHWSFSLFAEEVMYFWFSNYRKNEPTKLETRKKMDAPSPRWSEKVLICDDEVIFLDGIPVCR